MEKTKTKRSPSTSRKKTCGHCRECLKAGKAAWTLRSKRIPKQTTMYTIETRKNHAGSGTLRVCACYVRRGVGKPGKREIGGRHTLRRGTRSDGWASKSSTTSSSLSGWSERMSWKVSMISSRTSPASGPSWRWRVMIWRTWARRPSIWRGRRTMPTTGHAPTGTGADMPHKSSRRLKSRSTITWGVSEICERYNETKYLGEALDMIDAWQARCSRPSSDAHDGHETTEVGFLVERPQ